MVERVGSCSVVCVSFYDADHFKLIQEGLLWLPVDCLPQMGHWVKISPFETGHDGGAEIEGGVLAKGTIAGVVAYIEWSYFYDNAEGTDAFEDSHAFVNIYVNLTLIDCEPDLGLKKWAASHGLRLKKQVESKLILEERTEPPDA